MQCNVSTFFYTQFLLSKFYNSFILSLFLIYVKVYLSIFCVYILTYEVLFSILNLVLIQDRNIQAVRCTMFDPKVIIVKTEMIYNFNDPAYLDFLDYTGEDAKDIIRLCTLAVWERANLILLAGFPHWDTENSLRELKKRFPNEYGEVPVDAPDGFARISHGEVKHWGRVYDNFQTLMCPEHLRGRILKCLGIQENLLPAYVPDKS